jgi:hypothetical protein
MGDQPNNFPQGGEDTTQIIITVRGFKLKRFLSSFLQRSTTPPALVGGQNNPPILQLPGGSGQPGSRGGVVGQPITHSAPPPQPKGGQGGQQVARSTPPRPAGGVVGQPITHSTPPRPAGGVVGQPITHSTPPRPAGGVVGQPVTRSTPATSFSGGQTSGVENQQFVAPQAFEQRSQPFPVQSPSSEAGDQVKNNPGGPRGPYKEPQLVEPGALPLHQIEPLQPASTRENQHSGSSLVRVVSSVDSVKQQPADAPSGNQLESSRPRKMSALLVSSYMRFFYSFLVALPLIFLFTLFATKNGVINTEKAIQLLSSLIIIIILLLFSFVAVTVFISEQQQYEQEKRDVNDQPELPRGNQEDMQEEIHSERVASPVNSAEYEEQPVKVVEVNSPKIRSSSQSNLQNLPPFESESKHLGPPEPRSKDLARHPVDPPDYYLEDHPHEKYYPMPGNVFELGFGWRVVGASMRGYGHYNGKYREDDFDLKIFPLSKHRSAVLVGIADGVSSKEYSRLGARAAVQGAVNAENLKESLDNLYSIFRKGSEFGAAEQIRLWPEIEEETWNIFYKALDCAASNVIACVEAYDNKFSLDDLHSTLMIFLAFPISEQQLFVAAHQVGDGVLFGLRQGLQPRERWQWLLQAQIQASGNEVQPFLRSDPEKWRTAFRCKILENALCVMGMTDGIADDIEPPRDPGADPFDPVEAFYEEKIKPVYDRPDPASELIKAIGYHQRQSFDDRTLICVHNEQQ